MKGEQLPNNTRTILCGLLASAVMIAFCVLLGVALWLGTPQTRGALVIVGTPEIEPTPETSEHSDDFLAIAFQDEEELRLVNDAGRAVMNRSCMILAGGATGTGFIFTPNIMVTANHVVVDAPSTSVTLYCFTAGSGLSTTHTGTIINQEPDYDVAFIRVNGSPVVNAPAMQFSPNLPELLEPLHMYGFERDDEDDEQSFIGMHRPTSWFASGDIREVDELNCEALQVDLLTGLAHQGNSGGPVFNERGQIVGMVIIIFEDRNVTLMVPAFIIESLLQLEGHLPPSPEE